MFPVWLLEGQIERKCQNRISKGNSELTGAQWVPSRAVLAYVCPKRPNMGQIDPRDIGADLDFGADLALSILQCAIGSVISSLEVQLYGLSYILLKTARVAKIFEG